VLGQRQVEPEDTALQTRKMMFAVRAEVLRELMRDGEWRKILETAETAEDLEWVVTEYCLAKGYKVKQLAK